MKVDVFMLSYLHTLVQIAQAVPFFPISKLQNTSNRVLHYTVCFLRIQLPPKILFSESLAINYVYTDDPHSLSV